MQVMGRSARMARHHKRHQAAEINLVSMIDMLTILVFFLLVHGGFLRLAILELNLPAAQSEPSDAPPEFQLEVTVREAAIEVGDRTTGLLTRIEKQGDRHNFAALSAYLVRIKKQFPDKLDVTLLLEPRISYDVVVSVMDTVRVSQTVDTENNRIVRTELFPEISMGDAPVVN